MTSPTNEIGGKGGRRGRRHGGEQPVVGEATFESYYGRPVVHAPVWKARDIAGYLFLGGLAGASSLLAAGADATGRPGLARTSKVASTVAIGLSGAALVHDLGRPDRFVNMLRVVKPSSPMSMGSWLLMGYSPCSAAATLSAVTGRLPLLGAAGTAGAAVLGSVVATYTGALIADTAVPAWHEGYRQMPFLFAASATSAAAGLGLAAAPLRETAPARVLAIAGGVAEVGILRAMKRRMGMAGEAFAASKKGHRYERAAVVATTAGTAVAALFGRRSRFASIVAGTALVAGSALTRFAVFEAGVTSAEDPRYTVVPQRARRDASRRLQPT